MLGQFQGFDFDRDLFRDALFFFVAQFEFPVFAGAQSLFGLEQTFLEFFFLDPKCGGVGHCCSGGINVDVGGAGCTKFERWREFLFSNFVASAENLCPPIFKLQRQRVNADENGLLHKEHDRRRTKARPRFFQNVGPLLLLLLFLHLLLHHHSQSCLLEENLLKLFG